MIEFRNLTKHYGPTLAVDGFTAAVRSGAVTAFLGPNGAGKSTTMRMAVGLCRPTAGTALINGREYTDQPTPLREVGVVFDARSALGSRRVIDHLRWLTYANALPRRRVGEVLDICGIAGTARKRAGRLSLGMAQRLALAAALLGDPGVLILDEPTNGLDPEGIVWMRRLLRRLAAEGRTVLVSSHLMGEMAETADHVLIIGRGRLLADCALGALPTLAGLSASIRARCEQPERLVTALVAAESHARRDETGAVISSGLTSQRVATIAAEEHLVLTELVEVAPTLEQAYLHLTAASTDHVGRAGDGLTAHPLEARS
jgi:ABC-2 type transport system ATP-binding protein